MRNFIINFVISLQLERYKTTLHLWGILITEMVNYLITGFVLAVVISFSTADLIQFTGKCIPCCNFTPIVGFTINDVSSSWCSKRFRLLFLIINVSLQIHPHSNILLVTSNGPLQVKNYTQTATRFNETTTLLKESFQPLGTNLPQTKNTYFHATKKSGVYNFLRQSK